MNKDRYMSYEVYIEPKFIPGEGRACEDWRSITLTVYAKDINDAILKAKDLVRVDDSVIDVVSASCTNGHTYRF